MKGTGSIMKHKAQGTFRYLQSAWTIMVFGLVITSLATIYTKSTVNKIAEQKFDFACGDIKGAIAERMSDHARILRSGASFFDSSDLVTRKEWHTYADRQDLEQQLPGIQGLGFSLLIPKERLGQHTRQIRSEGFPEYQVKPAGDREIYSSIIYLEPFSKRNLRAFGYDMFSEPVRRAAMELARDTDSATLSGKVLLVQETAKEVQAGTLMYVPVYRKGMPANTVEERRAALYGWVYSPYRMNDLMQGILGDADILQDKGLNLKIHDGDELSPSTLLYEHRRSPVGASELPPRFTRNIPVDFNGHRWTLLFTQAGVSPFSAAYSVVWLTIVAGLIFTLLLNAMFRALTTRIETQRIAEQLTADLQKSEERYSVTLAAVNDGIWDWHIPSGNAFFSPIYYALLGYADNEFPACYDSWRLLVHPEDLNRVERDLQQSIETGRAFDIPLRMRMKSGEWLWVSTRGKIIEQDSNGKAVRAAGTLTDITGRKRAEQEIQDKNTELEGFAYTVSHDLKSPLITIQSYAGMIAKDMEAGRHERARQDIKRIEGAAGKMTDLLADLLELSRVGRMMNEPSIIDMNRLVADTLTQLAGPLKQSQVAVAVQPDLPAVTGDQKRIAEVVQNLVENAIKYRGDQATPRIEIGVRQGSKGTIFFVSDNGKGIDPAHHERIFGLFNKLDTDSEGTGVGLALVKRIIEMHGGKVWVESEGEGMGSRFCFTVGS